MDGPKETKIIAISCVLNICQLHTDSIRNQSNNIERSVVEHPVTEHIPIRETVTEYQY